MDKLITSLVILLIILVGTLSLVTSDMFDEKISEDVPYTHSFTKAFCTETNFCQDFEITCKNTQLIKISPITGASVQLPSNWEDTRSIEQKNKLC